MRGRGTWDLRTRGAAVGLALGLLVGAAHAAAQDVGEARERFERGLALFEEGRLDAALAEFTRAYEVAPNPHALYNIARVHAALGDAVNAVRYYERFLLEIGSAVDARERRRVERDLAAQRARIGLLQVDANVADAIVAVDGVDVAGLPLAEPVRVSAGRHVVAVRAAGYEHQTRELSLAGGTRETLRFELSPLAHGALRVRSSLPGVELSVDGAHVGSTPLDAALSVTPGRHAVVARRAGYLEQRFDVEIAAGAEREITVDLARDPSARPGVLGLLTLTLPAAPATIRVDGRPVAEERLELPAGTHHVRLEVQGREPFEAEVEVPARDERALAPRLAWTASERAARLAGADAQRVAGFALLGAGVALAAAGVGATAHNESRAPAVDEEYRELSACQQMAGPMGDPSLFCPSWHSRAEANNALRDEIAVLRGVGYGLLGLGAAGLALGLGLALAAPDAAGVDRSASARATLRIGPGSIALAGTF